jgi:peptidoglycan L-alanyl-D-glutamate endopeptidase CwlK
MTSSRNIDDLHPYVAMMCHDWVAACQRAGIDVLITSTFRDNASQDAIYAIGRTVRGADPIPVVRPMGRTLTNAKGGQSFHNYRLAFDFVPLIGGKPQWNDLPLIRQCGEIGENLGLEWAGRWTKFKELLHLQYTDGLTIAELQAGQTIHSHI